MMAKATDGRSALHVAAERGLPKLCKRMIDIGGADVVNMVAADGKTCLHYCAAMTWIPRKKPADEEAERALLAPFHMGVPQERSTKVGRLLGDWGLTPERTPAALLARM